MKAINMSDTAIEVDRIRLTISQVLGICSVLALVLGAYYTSNTKDSIQDNQIKQLTNAVTIYSEETKEQRKEVAILNQNIHNLNVNLEKIITTEGFVVSEVKLLKDDMGVVKEDVAKLKVAIKMAK